MWSDEKGKTGPSCGCATGRQTRGPGWRPFRVVCFARCSAAFAALVLVCRYLPHQHASFCRIAPPCSWVFCRVVPPCTALYRLFEIKKNSFSGGQKTTAIRKEKLCASGFGHYKHRADL